MGGIGWPQNFLRSMKPNPGPISKDPQARLAGRSNRLAGCGVLAGQKVIRGQAWLPGRLLSVYVDISLALLSHARCSGEVGGYLINCQF